MSGKVLTAMIVGAALFGSGGSKDWQLPPETEKFRPGKGADLVAGNCLLCHSADYVSTQPPLARTAWRATVEKMRVKYGAPIATNKIDDLVGYLTATYGPREK